MVLYSVFAVREGSQKKNVKVWSLTKPADPPPMLKCGLLIVKIFFNFFWLPICFKPYKRDFRQKNIFEILKNNKILKKYQKNSDSSTACQNTLCNQKVVTT